jgi:hypothetical protein
VRTGGQDFYGWFLIGGKRPLRNFDGMFVKNEGFGPGGFDILLTRLLPMNFYITKRKMR